MSYCLDKLNMNRAIAFIQIWYQQIKSSRIRKRNWNSDYLVYRKICELVENSRVISHDIYFTVERKILQEIIYLLLIFATKFLTERISARRVEAKIGHGYKVGNLFVTFKVYR